MKPLARGTALLLLLCLLTAMLPAQDNGTGQTGTTEDEDTEEEGTEPVPYEAEEFPRWARELRRGEVIALGSFPVVLILSNISYDLVRFGVESWKAGEWNYTYAPWFFGPPNKPPLTEDERIGVIVTAAGISVGVALIDFIVGRAQGRERRSDDAEPSTSRGATPP